jgi:hypothetical protein
MEWFAVIVNSSDEEEKACCFWELNRRYWISLRDMQRGYITGRESLCFQPDSRSSRLMKGDPSVIGIVDLGETAVQLNN